jgi:hypothetical protein
LFALVSLLHNASLVPCLFKELDSQIVFKDLNDSGCMAGRNKEIGCFDRCYSKIVGLNFFELWGEKAVFKKTAPIFEGNVREQELGACLEQVSVNDLGCYFKTGSMQTEKIFWKVLNYRKKQLFVLRQM